MPWRKLIPWLLAVFYLWLAMRGADQGPVAPDAGQHATNGALIYDYARSGDGASPVQFAKAYLAHYPALSIGYHPPVYHVIEACFYGLFGVSLLASRLAVAIMAALSVVLLYSLVRRTHGTDWFATLCVVVFFSLRMSQQLASDVMLEFPSLMFVLLAIHCLLDFQNGFRWRAAILYAVISSFAIWTKQHAAFLGLIPFCMVITTGRWSELKRFPIWGGALLFGASCLLLAAFMGSVVGDAFTPASLVADSDWAQFVAIRNIKYYTHRLWIYLGWPILVATLVACGAYLVQRIRNREKNQSLAMYAAWAAATWPVPIIAWQYDERYLFAGFPAFVVILLDMARRASEQIVKEPAARWVTIVAAVLLFGVRVRDDVTHISGPVEAAEYVWERKPDRVLVCGRGEYQFIFAMRCLAGDQPSMVILRGSKAPAASMRADNFDQFAHDYGIQYVVIGDAWKALDRQRERPPPVRPWDSILKEPTEHMQLDQKSPMTNTFQFMEGDIFVYEFTDPSPNPRNDFDLRMNLLDGNLKVDLEDDARESSVPGPGA